MSSGMITLDFWDAPLGFCCLPFKTWAASSYKPSRFLASRRYKKKTVASSGVASAFLDCLNKRWKKSNSEANWRIYIYVYIYISISVNMHDIDDDDDDDDDDDELKFIWRYRFDEFELWWTLWINERRQTSTRETHLSILVATMDLGCCQEAFGSQVLRCIAIAKKSFCGPFPCIHPCLQDAMPTDPGCLATMQCQQRLQASDQVCLAAGPMFQIFEVQQSMEFNGTKN